MFSKFNMNCRIVNFFESLFYMPVFMHSFVLTIVFLYKKNIQILFILFTVKTLEIKITRTKKKKSSSWKLHTGNCY